MRELVDNYFAVDLYDAHLWSALIAVIVHATAWRLIAKGECKSRLLTKSLFCTKKQAGNLVVAVDIVLGTVRLFFIQSALRFQPRWIFFHNNEIIVLGLWCILASVVLATSCVIGRGFPMCLVCAHFDYDYGDNRARPFPNTLLDDPLSVATALAVLGYSLLSACQTGVLLAALMYLFNSCWAVRLLSRPRAYINL